MDIKFFFVTLSIAIVLLVVGERAAIEDSLDTAVDINISGKKRARTMWEVIAPSGVKYNDVAQGELGTCYFLASIASIANMRPELIQKMFVNGPEEEAKTAIPVFEVEFLLNGYPSRVAVDDKVPTDVQRTNKPFFVKWNDGDQVWPVILEKAWAKIFGSFKGVEGGVIAEVFKAITQAPVDEIDHYREQDSSFGVKKDQLWDSLVMAHNNRLPIGAATDKPNPAGVAAGHAYAVLGVVQDLSTLGDFFKSRLARAADKRGVHIYNPWAANQYTGFLRGQSTSQGDFFMTFDEYVLSYRSTTIAHTLDFEDPVDHKRWSYYSSAHVMQTSQSTVAQVLTFTIQNPFRFAVQLEWPSARFLPGCDEGEPVFSMLVKRPDGGFQFVEKHGMFFSNARADFEGSGTYQVFVTASLEQKMWMKKVVVNVYAAEEVKIDTVDTDPRDFFMRAQGFCPQITTNQGTFHSTKALWGLPYYQNIDSSSPYKYIFFSPKRVKTVPGGVLPMGSNTWHMMDDYNAFVQDSNLAITGVGSVDANSIFHCTELPNLQAQSHSRMAYQVQGAMLNSGQAPITQVVTRANYGQVAAPVVRKSYYTMTTYQPQSRTVDQCREALDRLESGMLDDVQGIRTKGFDAVFPHNVETSIAPPSTDCGDAAHGIQKSCSEYNHWQSLMGMFGGQVAHHAPQNGQNGNVGPSRRPSKPIGKPDTKPQDLKPVDAKCLFAGDDKVCCLYTQGQVNSCRVVNNCQCNVKCAARLQAAYGAGVTRTDIPSPADYAYSGNVAWCSDTAQFVNFVAM